MSINHNDPDERNIDPYIEEFGPANALERKVTKVLAQMADRIVQTASENEWDESTIWPGAWWCAAVQRDRGGGQGVDLCETSTGAERQGMSRGAVSSTASWAPRLMVFIFPPRASGVAFRP